MVLGALISGGETLKNMEKQGTEDGDTKTEVKIVDCGVV